MPDQAERRGVRRQEKKEAQQAREKSGAPRAESRRAYRGPGGRWCEAEPAIQRRAHQGVQQRAAQAPPEEQQQGSDYSEVKSTQSRSW